MKYSIYGHVLLDRVYWGCSTGVALQLRTADRPHIGSIALEHTGPQVFFVYVHDSCTKLYNVKINRAFYTVSYNINYL